MSDSTVTPDTPAGNLPELLTTKQAAELVNVGERSLWRWSRCGIAPAPIHLGCKVVRYRRSEILSWIRAVLDISACATVAGVSADAVNRFAAGLKERGLSARRIQAHLAAVKGFSRWLAAEGKLAANPLASVKKPNPESDRQMERRMLLPEEWIWLRSVTLATAAVWRGIPATEQVALYATAVQTGLRASELRSLTRGRLFLTGSQPYITCKAGSTSKWTWRLSCGGMVATKAPTAPVFNLPDPDAMATMLRRGNGAAGMGQGGRTQPPGTRPADGKRLSRPSQPRERNTRLPQSAAHLRGVVGDGGGQSQNW